MHVPPPPVIEKRGLPVWAWLLIVGVPLLLCGIGAFLAVRASQEMGSIMEDLGMEEEDAGEADSIYAANYAVVCIDDFVADIGRWPTKEEGLDALLVKPKGLAKWNGPYAYEFFTDEWGNPVTYEPLATGYRVTSLGEDGKPGGTGKAADLIVERRMTKP